MGARGVPVLLAAGLGGCVLGGCSSGREAPVAASVREFFTAVERRDGAGACARLLPEAAEGLETDGSPCEREVLELDLQGGPLSDVEVWGGQARVRAGGDTVFATRWGSQWRVAAAGCTPREDLPYECDVEA
ncbi:hypothetical protein ACIBF1_00895 [Spirillospora sp. NPDC050679]